MEQRTDVNLVHHYAGELRRIRGGVPPGRVLNKGIRCRLEIAGMLKRGRGGDWVLSAECIEILSALSGAREQFPLKAYISRMLVLVE
jgi:hypothetical protein